MSSAKNITGKKHDRMTEEFAVGEDDCTMDSTTTTTGTSKKPKFDTRMDVDYLHRPAGTTVVSDANGKPDFASGPIPFEAGVWGEHEFVTISEDRQTVSFKLQHGGYLTHGSNGTYVDDIVIFAKELLAEQSKTRPSRETSLAITKLEEALHCLFQRSVNRHFEGTHGTGK